MAVTSITVRPLESSDLDEADRIMRLAFGTFLGLPGPRDFMGDGDYVRTRWTAEPESALGAFAGDRLIGSNFVTQWGSVGFFGPLSVEPELWDQGVARRLLDETMAIFGRWDLTHTGLFTFGHSPKHIALYQSYGFMPRFLTPILTKKAAGGTPGDLASEAADLDAVVAECARVSQTAYPGLEVSRDIRATLEQSLGDVVLVRDGGRLVAFAVCHTGPGTEAGSGACLVKFGVAASGSDAGGRFDRLMSACEAYAESRGAGVVVAGVNTARRGAYQHLVDDGYRAALIGVTMHRPDDSAYHHADAWVVDDWR
jgi:GNAT superfamily N-acetyltransferase